MSMNLFSDSLPGLMKIILGESIGEIRRERDNLAKSDPRFERFQVGPPASSNKTRGSGFTPGKKTSVYIDILGFDLDRDLRVRVRISEHDSRKMVDGISLRREEKTSVTKLFVLKDIREAIRFVEKNGTIHDWYGPNINKRIRRLLVHGSNVTLLDGRKVAAQDLSYLIAHEKIDFLNDEIRNIRDRVMKSIYLFLRDADQEEWKKEGFISINEHAGD